MDVFTVQVDNTEELLASELDTRDVDDLRDWFCYTKPIGSDLKILARTVSKDNLFYVHTAGNQSDKSVTDD